MKSIKESPYGKIVVLSEDATEVECWNFTDRSTHTLPAGTRLLLEHVHDATTTTCMLLDEDGKHSGIMLKHADGHEQRGYRFILQNEQLNRIAKAGLPAKTFDMVGAMIAYDQGELSQKETRALFLKLKKAGMLGKLQGHFQRNAIAMGIVNA